MKEYYECHITMEGKPEEIRPLVEKLKWKFSSIDGDPVMGDGVKCYATRMHNGERHLDDVITVVELTADLLVAKGIKVTRRKIERVVYDTKTNVVVTATAPLGYGGHALSVVGFDPETRLPIFQDNWNCSDTDCASCQEAR